MKKVLAILVVVSIALCGCSANSVLNSLSKVGINVTPDEVISAVQGTITAIQWIEPIAGIVLGVFFPAELPLYTSCCAAADAAIKLAQDDIAAYQANPTGGNYQALVDNLTDLSAFFQALENAYKGGSIVKSAAALGVK